MLVHLSTQCIKRAISDATGWQSGNPYAIDPPMQAGFGDAFHIVSVAYRYIPQVGLKEMVEDCTDAFDWCRARLPTLLPDIDIDSYFVGGDSAGGTLASLMGHHLSPRPKVVLNVYGVMDFTDFRVDNARGIKSDPANGKGDEYEQLLQSRLADRDPAHAQFARASRWLLTLPLSTARAFWGLPDLEFDQKEAVIECDAYDYTSKHHLRFDLLFRKDECPDDKTWSDRLIQYSSLHLLDQEKGYPPTFILHGTGDSIVPVSQGYNFEKKLKEIGVEVATSYPEGEEHAFDQRFNVSLTTQLSEYRNSADWTGSRGRGLGRGDCTDDQVCDQAL